MITKVFWVTADSWQDIEPIGGNTEQELTRLIARSKKYGPIYTGFNQGAIPRFHYSCVIVSFLRSWYSLYASTDDFTDLMYDLCDHMEEKWIWDPHAGGTVSVIGDEFVKYMNARFPDRKVWKAKLKYGSSAMGGCLVRNIPIITAYLSSSQYYWAQSDGEITEIEANSISKSAWGHCITITGIWLLWSYLKFQDNYEGQAGNTYITFNFKKLLRTIWYPNCFWVLLPENMTPADIKDRAKLSQI